MLCIEICRLKAQTVFIGFGYKIFIEMLRLTKLNIHHFRQVRHLAALSQSVLGVLSVMRTIVELS